MRSSQVYTNDIMIAIVGATIGQVGVYLSDREANINQAIALVRLKQGIDVQYVKELIKSKIGQISLNRLKITSCCPCKHKFGRNRNNSSCRSPFKQTTRNSDTY